MHYIIIGDGPIKDPDLAARIEAGRIWRAREDERYRLSQLPAGDELNTLVTRLMHIPKQRYSSDTRYFWQLLDRLRFEGYTFSLHYWPDEPDDACWQVDIEWKTNDGQYGSGFSHGATPSLAVCHTIVATADLDELETVARALDLWQDPSANNDS